MFLRPLVFPVLFSVAAAVVGCGSKPPPKPVEPVVVAPPPPPPEAPPPPKCEKLDEHCDAKADTRARVAHADLYVTPVTGWTFAQEEATTVAQASDSGPAMAFVGYDEDKDPKKDATARDALVAELFKVLAVETKPAKKVAWKSPKAAKAIGDLKLDVWELAGYTRGAKKGTVVVVAGPIGDGKGALAVSFAPDDDKSADEAIMKSFESLGKSK